MPVFDTLRNELEAALQAEIDEKHSDCIKKIIQSFTDEIEADLYYRLKDALAPNLVAFVVDMAERTIKAILGGNDNEMRR